MKTSTYILAGIFVVLLALTIITGQCNKRATKPNLPKNYLSVDSLSTTKIVLTRPTDKVTLEKIDGVWQITDPIKYKANQEAVGQMLSTAQHLKLVNLISKNVEKQKKFSVDSTGTLAEFYAGDKLQDKIIIGKMSPAGSVTFVRKPNSDEVYQVQGTIKSRFSKKVRDWREKIIIKLDKEEIRQIDIHTGDETYSVAQGDSGWVIVSNAVTETPEQSKITTLLNSFKNLKAVDFIDSPQQDILSIFDNPDGIVSVYPVDSQTTETIYLAKNDKYKNRYIVKKNDNTSTLFTIYKSIGERLLKKKAELME